MIKGFGMKFTAALQDHPLLCSGRAPGRMCLTRDGLRAQAQAAGVAPAGKRLGSKGDLPLRLGVRTIFCVVFLFLLVQSFLVQCFGTGLAPVSPVHAQATQKSTASPKKQQPAPGPAPEIRCGSEPLPGPVADMREAILGGVASGHIEDLRHAWELNELKPDLGAVDISDPIAHWKQVSGDGEGREILAALGEILEAGCAVLPLGRDLENNRIYVWPYLAETDLAKLSPAQEVQLLRLVPPAAAKEMWATGKYTHWRLGIGADGTWHFFRRGP
jgi:hypothetical protein